MGQEASNTGLCAALDESDWLIATHRGHGFYLAKCGCNVKSMMAEMFGLNEGMCQGLGGSMHFSDMDKHYVCSTGVVAGGVPISVGMALSLKYMKKNGVSVCAFGDGASNQGMALESLNLASFWKVPVLFYCENNQYAVSSPSKKFVSNTTISKRALGFGVESKSIDGNNIECVYNAVKEAKDYMANTGRPYLIESVTYRFNGHSRSDKLVYRTSEEDALWADKCPIVNYKNYLIDKKVITETEYISLTDKCKRIAEEAVKYCKNNTDVISADEAISYVYSDKEVFNE